jgi:hypothetical protein
LVSVGLLVILAIIGIVSYAAVDARHRAASAVEDEAVPELVASQRLYRSLADANSAASIIYLKPPSQQAALRPSYDADLKDAGDALAAISAELPHEEAAQRSVRIITRNLPVFAQAIDSSLANGLQGNAVGGAYLRAGTRIMSTTILPAATTLHLHAVDRLRDEFDDGTAAHDVPFVIVAAVIAVGALVAAQVLVARRSRRVLNVGLLGPTVVVIGLLAWTGGKFVSSQDSLVRAQRNGSDAVEVLAAMRILNLRAQAAENVALIERDGSNDTDFDQITDRLGGADANSGLLRQARHIATRDDSVIPRLGRIVFAYRSVQNQHVRVHTLNDNGEYLCDKPRDDGVVVEDCVLSVATGAEAAAVRRFDSALSAGIAHARSRLDTEAADARTGFTLLSIAIPTLLVIAAALLLIGVDQRVKEFR